MLDAHRHTDRPNYRNPRCACAPRVNYVHTLIFDRGGPNELVLPINVCTVICCRKQLRRRGCSLPAEMEMKRLSTLVNVKDVRDYFKASFSWSPLHYAAWLVVHQHSSDPQYYHVLMYIHV